MFVLGRKGVASSDSASQSESRRSELVPSSLVRNTPLLLIKTPDSFHGTARIKSLGSEIGSWHLPIMSTAAVSPHSTLDGNGLRDEKMMHRATLPGYKVASYGSSGQVELVAGSRKEMERRRVWGNRRIEYRVLVVRVPQRLWLMALVTLKDGERERTPSRIIMTRRTCLLYGTGRTPLTFLSTAWRGRGEVQNTEDQLLRTYAVSTDDLSVTRSTMEFCQSVAPRGVREY